MIVIENSLKTITSTTNSKTFCQCMPFGSVDGFYSMFTTIGAYCVNPNPNRK